MSPHDTASDVRATYAVNGDYIKQLRLLTGRTQAELAIRWKGKKLPSGTKVESASEGTLKKMEAATGRFRRSTLVIVARLFSEEPEVKRRLGGRELSWEDLISRQEGCQAITALTPFPADGPSPSGQLVEGGLASGTETTFFDRFVKWLPVAMDRHMREMLAGIQLTDEKARDGILDKLCDEARLSANGMSETLLEIPTCLHGTPDHCPTPAETAELVRGLSQPLEVWVPSLSFATPCLLRHLGLVHGLAVDTSRPHSVRLATDIRSGGEPDVLTLGPRAFLRLCERPNFRHAYRVADRWHSVDARILAPAVSEVAVTNMPNRVIYTSGEFSTEQQMAFHRLTAGDFIRNSEGVATGQIDPLDHLCRAGDEQVMAFAPFAYAAEGLGLGRQVALYPKELLGQPMFLVFHARLWRDKPRLASLLLARLRHAWLRLATSHEERANAAANVLRDTDFLWTCFHGLNLRPLLFARDQTKIVVSGGD